MKSVRKRLTYANVMSTIAVFLAVGGATALAAGQLGKNTVGTKQLKNNAVTSAKVKNAAITGGKLANGAVTGAKIGGGAVGASNLAANSVGASALADNSVTSSKVASGAISGDKIANGAVSGDKIGGGAVGTGNLSNGAVTREKLAAGERSEVLQFEETSSTAELPHGMFENPTNIMSAALPAGRWVVTAQVSLVYSVEAESAPENGSECFLNDDGTTIGEGGSTYRVGLFFFAGSVSMTGVSDGGTITMSCKSFNKNSFGLNRQIIATRVGSVNGAS